MFFKLFKWLVIVAVIIAAAVFAFLKFHPVFGGKPDAASLEKIRASKAFDGNTFVNLEPTELMTSDEQPSIEQPSIFQWARYILTEDTSHKNPNEPLPTVPLDTAKLKDGSVAWFGHSTVLFQTGGKRFITDPVFHRASPVPFTGKPFKMSHEFSVAELPELDAVLISHDHYDHLDYQAIQEIDSKTKQFIVPLGVKAHLQRWGVADSKIIELDWQETAKVGDVAVTLVPSRHFSGRALDNRNSTLWGGYVVKSPDLSLYFSADSGYGKHYADIIAQYAPFDFVMIENGAYDQRWAQIHEMPEQAVQALRDVQATRAMPIHWGKFDLAKHKWTDPIERFTAAAATQNIELATPRIGEVFNVREPLPQQKWWKSVR